MKIADAAVRKAALIEPAVDEARAIATLSAESLERQLTTELPAIRQTKAGGHADDVVVISVILVRARRGRREAAGGSRDHTEVLRVDAEGEVASMQRIRRHRVEEAGLPRPGRRSKSDLVLARHRGAHPVLSEQWGDEQEAKKEH